MQAPELSATRGWSSLPRQLSRNGLLESKFKTGHKTIILPARGKRNRPRRSEGYRHVGSPENLQVRRHTKGRAEGTRGREKPASTLYRTTGAVNFYSKDQPHASATLSRWLSRPRRSKCITCGLPSNGVNSNVRVFALARVLARVKAPPFIATMLAWSSKIMSLANSALWAVDSPQDS